MVYKRYLVRLKRTKVLRQKYHIRIESASNGKCLFSSEKYTSYSYARYLAEEVARYLGAAIIEDFEA